MEQRQAFFSLYIDTVTNAKFVEGVSTFKLECLVAKPSQFTDVRFVSCIHHSIDVKIEEPYRRRSRADAMRCDVEKNLITAYLAHPRPHEQMRTQCAGVLKNDVMDCSLLSLLSH